LTQDECRVRHDDARLRAVTAGKPRAGVAHHFAAGIDIDVLAEVVDVARRRAHREVVARDLLYLSVLALVLDDDARPDRAAFAVVVVDPYLLQLGRHGDDEVLALLALAGRHTTRVVEIRPPARHQAEELIAAERREGAFLHGEIVGELRFVFLGHGRDRQQHQEHDRGLMFGRQSSTSWRRHGARSLEGGVRRLEATGPSEWSHSLARAIIWPSCDQKSAAGASKAHADRLARRLCGGQAPRRALAGGGGGGVQAILHGSLSAFVPVCAGPRGSHVGAAEDAAQSTLSRALENLASYRGEAQLFTWLCAICRSEISVWRRRTGRREAHIVLLEDRPESLGALDSLAADGDDPAAELQRDQRARHIQVVLDRLPPRYGDALEWKYVEGYSAQEIAARLRIGTEAANSLLARAKRAFKETYTSMLEQELAGSRASETQ
jgi:RNA polymerase sigma-70 factor (ECF subfamily)